MGLTFQRPRELYFISRDIQRKSRWFLVVWGEERQDWGDGWTIDGRWEGKITDPEAPVLVTQEISILSSLLGSSVGHFLL